MTFFAPPPPKPVPQKPAEAWKPPASRGERGIRSVVQRDPTVADHPHHRPDGRTHTVAEILDRFPDGCLFQVDMDGKRLGFFDKLGYWCVHMNAGEYRVTRGAPRAVMKLLSKPQRQALGRVRLNARRAGVR